MPKPQLFPCLATAAIQADLDHPSFIECIRKNRSYCRRVRVLIPASAKVPNEAGITFVRATTDELFLHELLTTAVNMLDAQHPIMMLADPLVMMNDRVLDFMNSAFLSKQRMGNAWMATALAIAMDKSGKGGKIENEGLRWFAGGANGWRVMTSDMDTKPEMMGKKVPFASPIWGGWVAGWAEKRIQRMRYHDVTDLHAVASFMPDRDVPGTTGYGRLTFNPPVLSFAKKLLAAKK